jgi:hypothetical protein
VWTVDGIDYQNSMPYHFRVLGDYRHTRYNSPNEVNCGGNAQNVYITTSQCAFNNGTLKSQFVSQVNLNGSGISINYGNIGREFSCLNPTNNPPSNSSGISFRGNVQITGSCGAVNDTTVAAHASHPYLSCGDSVYIHGVGIKTVSDRCPACNDNNYHHLDNYTTQSTACSSNAVGDLGNFKTIKLF